MLTISIALGIFLTAVLLFEGCYYFIRSRSRVVRNQQRVVERLQSWNVRPDQGTPAELVAKETYSDIPWLNAALEKLKGHHYFGWLTMIHEQAKAPFSLATYVL